MLRLKTRWTRFVESSNQEQTPEESVTEPSSIPRAEGAKVRPARQDASPVLRTGFGRLRLHRRRILARGGAHFRAFGA